MAIIKKRAHDLRELTVVAQCLDSQWIPAELAADWNHQAGFEGLGEARKKAIRRELMGAMLMSEQLVVNRAVLSSHDVFGDMYADKAQKDGLLQSLRDESIVVFFAEERSFEDNVSWVANVHPVAGDQTAAVRKALAAEDVACLRFDWEDDKANKKIVAEQLSRRFHDYIHGITSANIEILANDFGIEPERHVAFDKRLIELSKLAASLREPDRLGGKSFITRSNVYEEFVTPSGRHVGGFIDEKKPFAREIKALVDLKYNCNLSDALLKYAITAQGDVDRTVLQDGRDNELRNLGKFDSEDEGALIDLLTRGAFDEMSTFNSFEFLHELSFGDVSALKQGGSWKEYSELVKTILPARNSGRLAEHAIFDRKNLEHLSLCHANLLLQAGNAVANRALIEEAKGWWEIVVSFVNVGVKIFCELNHQPTIECPREIEETFADTTAPILIEASFTVLDKLGRRRVVRKYPLLKKRLDDPAGVFRRTVEKLEDYKRKHASVEIHDASQEKMRADDRESTVNLPD
jgi:hypothetical protein